MVNKNNNREVTGLRDEVVLTFLLWTINNRKWSLRSNKINNNRFIITIWIVYNFLQVKFTRKMSLYVNNTKRNQKLIIQQNQNGYLINMPL